MNTLIKGIMIFVSLLSVCIIKLYYPAYQDDNVIEESIEKVITYETGIDIDLTPMSQEKE